MPCNRNCTECDLSKFARKKTKRKVCIWGTGEGDGFLIGEAPGAEEAASGKPFVGRSGKLLRPLLEKAGIEDPYITNVVKCQPPGNRKPEPDEIHACRPYLDEEIEERDPPAILLLGATAMRAMIGRTKITEMNGQVVEKNGRKYVCAFHPAFILRDPSKESLLQMAIQRYKAVLDGTDKNELPDWRIVDGSSLDDFLTEFSNCKSFSFDLETTGLEWWKCDINCIQFSLTLIDPESRKKTQSQWVIPMEIKSVLPRELRGNLIRYLVRLSKGKRVSGQNAKFDNLFLLQHFGVKFHLTVDSMLAHHTIDENSPSGLKVTSRTYLGAPDYDLPLKEKLGQVPDKWSKLFAYGAADAYYTEKLSYLFLRMMDSEDRWLFDNVVMPAARAFTDIERNGLYVDVDLMNRVAAEEKRKQLEVEAKLNKIAGRVVNWNAPGQVGDVLYRQFKITPLIYTPKGTPSTGESALIDIKHPVSKLLEEYRKHTKFISTYVGWEQDGEWLGGLRDYMDGPHMYISFKLNGTVTGRYSSRLHQIPRDGTIRNIFIAPPGWTHVQMDLSQAELRIIAIISKDPGMLHCFQTGEDIHWKTLMDTIWTGRGTYYEETIMTASRITDKAIEDIEFEDAIEIVRKAGPEVCQKIWDGWKEGRKKAKGINFGFPYGQSAPGFLAYAKNNYGFEPTLEEATQFRDTFFNSFSSLPNWHKTQKLLVRQDGYVRNLIGRKRRLPGIYSSDRSVVAECERQAINSPVQGFIGDYKAMILIELHEELPPDRFRITGEVHDSILFWVKNEYLDDTLRKVQRISNAPRLAREYGLKFPIPLTCDIEVGRWGAGKRWKG